MKEHTKTTGINTCLLSGENLNEYIYCSRCGLREGDRGWDKPCRPTSVEVKIGNMRM